MARRSQSVETRSLRHETTGHLLQRGLQLSGDLYGRGLRPADRRAGIVLCHGYTGVKDLYLPDNARVLNEAGYVVLAFDYKGWGASEGPAAGWRPTAGWPTSRRR